MTGPAAPRPDQLRAAGPPVAVVSGASRGIGAHLAEAFAQAGYVVRGCSRRGRTAGAGGLAGTGGMEVAAVDVSDPDAVRKFVAGVLASDGAIDVLVNNAGVTDAEVPIEESDPQEWWRTLQVDVLGPYLFTRAVLPSMLQRGRGRIINLNSGSGTKPGRVGSAYYVAKSALARITGSTHLSGQGRGVYAFDLMPGVVRTDMTRAMRAHDQRSEWTDPGDVRELALALASGELDAWSGRFVRAGVDSPASLRAAAPRLGPQARTVSLIPYGPDDPVA